MKIEKENKKYPWYLILANLPGAIILLSFLGLIVAYFLLIKDRHSKNTSEKNNRIEMHLLPYAMAVSIVIMGLITNNVLALNILKYFSVLSILIIAVQSFRFILNPLKIFDSYLLGMIEKEERIIPGFVNEFINRLKDKGLSFNSAIVTIVIVRFAKLIIEICGSPRIVLGLFLVYYFSVIVLTIFLFAVLLKTTYPYFIGSDSSYILASILRFTSGSGVTEILHAYNNHWVLAFESMVAFYYIVIAILAFGSIANYSTQEFQQKLKKIYDKEMGSLIGLQIDLIKEEVRAESNRE